VFFTVALLTFVAVPFCIHSVDEGHLGVYWGGGALLPKTTEPGYHFKLPFMTTFENVQITMQTDNVRNIPCGTSGGTMVYFEKIEVVNRLKKDHVYTTMLNYGVHYDKIWIFDKIHHEINQFCSSHSLQEVYIEKFSTLDDDLAQAIQRDCDKYNTGIEIISVRVTKPKIPEAIRQSFETVETEKTRLMVSTHTQKVVEKEAETERKRATIEALKVAEVSKINMEKEVAIKLANQKIQMIEDQMKSDSVKMQSDSEYYKLTKEAEANKLRLTPEFLQYHLTKALLTNTKIYFGDKIPNIWNGDEWKKMLNNGTIKA